MTACQIITEHDNMRQKQGAEKQTEGQKQSDKDKTETSVKQSQSGPVSILCLSLSTWTNVPTDRPPPYAPSAKGNVQAPALHIVSGQIEYEDSEEMGDR